MKLTELGFADWLEHAFGREVRIGRNPWFFDTDIDWWDPAPAVAVDYLTCLFSDPEPALQWFSDCQIAQGLTYLMNTSATGDNGWLYSTSVPGKDRKRCLEANETLFAKLFAPRCTPHLGHLSEESDNPLNGVCYMWWDGFPAIALPDDPDRAMLHEAAVRTMARILQLDSLACQESALHGLGHWHRDRPADVERVVDRFLATGNAADARLLPYAQAARCGCVL
jgi:hypothetical protein